MVRFSPPSGTSIKPTGGRDGNYRNYVDLLNGPLTMGKIPITRYVKLITIGNSKGIRIPKVLLQKHGWSGWLVLEERTDGVFLYSKEKTRLSWKETCRAMAAEREDWSDLDTALADGLD